ncbi:MAG: L-fucose:H+ symporter permease [Bacteroidales bacterium]|jgi:FHS family L-fucose permease-like MFS transporter|nr:L-fucose:H+ symporter permease [Bacteroidales bacterium]
MTKKRIVFSFIAVTLCFALWGFANDITNPMVKAFSKIFKMSVTDGALVQVAFYGGYFAMALPAALFIHRYSYKKGLILGLILFAAGAFGFLPAVASGNYYPFLIAYFVLTCGLSFLETSANPYILTLGDPKKAAIRINLAQSFNPIGSLMGMWIAMHFIQEKMNPLSTDERLLLSDEQFEAIKLADLQVVSSPYIFIGLIGLVLLFIIMTILPEDSKEDEDTTASKEPIGSTIRRIINTQGYSSGFVAQFFYVGAQIMCWTFIIQYGTEVFTADGMDEHEAEILSQKYNMVAMVFFCVSRFICTYLMKFFRPELLLTSLAVFAGILCLGVIVMVNEIGMACLVGISACMSLMFPTIYSLALRGLNHEDAKLGAAGQIMAILGGSVLPAVQALIIDSSQSTGESMVSISFVVPLISFGIVAFYGIKSTREITRDTEMHGIDVEKDYYE